ncbi:MAG: iron-sulfur cluster assembly scaffold protein [Dehalococcoidaceae bacterium]|nr:iron-sulfur cluster assembly scaffold protein [Dehalococcoidaceae bacterium]
MSDGALDKLREAIQQDLRLQGYSEKAVLHATAPENMGDMPEYNAFGVSFNDAGGMMTIWLKIEGGIIQNATFTTEKGDAPVACGSVLTGMVRGKRLEEAARIKPADVLDELGDFPPNQAYAADLAIEVLGEAIKDYPGC